MNSSSLALFLPVRRVLTSSAIPGWEAAQSCSPVLAKATATVSKGISALWLATNGMARPHHRFLCLVVGSFSGDPKCLASLTH